MSFFILKLLAFKKQKKRKQKVEKVVIHSVLFFNVPSSQLISIPSHLKEYAIVAVYCESNIENRTFSFRENSEYFLLKLFVTWTLLLKIKQMEWGNNISNSKSAYSTYVRAV